MSAVAVVLLLGHAGQTHGKGRDVPQGLIVVGPTEGRPAAHLDPVLGNPEHLVRAPLPHGFGEMGRRWPMEVIDSALILASPRRALDSDERRLSRSSCRLPPHRAQSRAWHRANAA